jgi:putative ABC transport system ATP-binding protein
MLIELERIGKVFKLGEIEIPALQSVTFRIDHGEFLAIIGPSGSGKTTLLDILGCLARPTSGRYLFEGRDTGAMSDEELAALRNRKIGFVFQTFHLLPRSTALENVALPLFYAGVKKKEREERGLSMLAAVGLADRIHHRPNQLSGGQQQRVAIARALINQPAMILADEPTGNLDTKSGREIIGLLEDLNRQGHTIVLVTHDRELAEYTHRIISLRDGLVVSDQSVKQAGQKSSAILGKI